MISKRAFLATTLAAAVAATAVAAIAGPASAQAWPARTLKILVPFPAGGPTDLVARLVADRLSAGLGQSVIVEDRPGGAGQAASARKRSRVPIRTATRCC
jgi:tripartite-type tricarboxylate transporter receptor subunit TctC